MKVYPNRVLDKGKIENRVTGLRSLRHTNPEVVKKLRTEAEDFEKNAERTRRQCDLGAPMLPPQWPF